jgi:hypothetical protein
MLNELRLEVQEISKHKIDHKGSELDGFPE